MTPSTNEIVSLFLTRQILEAEWEGLPLQHYLMIAKPSGGIDNDIRRKQLRSSLGYINDLRCHHPEREIGCPAKINELDEGNSP